MECRDDTDQMLLIRLHGVKEHMKVVVCSKKICRFAKKEKEESEGGNWLITVFI